VNRRNLLGLLGAIGLLRLLPRWAFGAAGEGRGFRRVRPSDSDWPSLARWEELNRQVGGQLQRVEFPLSICSKEPASAECEAVFKNLKNPYYIGDHAGLTQTSGWVDAWTSMPSVYAVAARSSQDVVAAVNFARENRLRVVVKGGGHSYQGTSNAADSLLIWTRPMSAVTLHDDFVASGCAQKPQPAVSVGAGAIWMHTYDAVTTRGGRYVQGGGCATVGVAGLIQSGGFGSFSKHYGLAAAALLEAEVVTADGSLRIANPCQHPDLFWGLKGGGGGSLGVVTRVTLRTRELPEFFGVSFLSVRATSVAAFRRLVGRFLGFYKESLYNPHWGESVRFGPANALSVNMVCHGLDRAQIEATWKPFLDWVAASPHEFSMEKPPTIASIPARHLWDTEFLQNNVPGVVLRDDRPAASERNLFWASNLGEAGQFLHGYESAWLPGSLLEPQRQKLLVDALLVATRHWSVALHFNKGLAGAPSAEIDAARDTATNPDVLTAFALAIIAGEGPPAYPGVSGHEPNLKQGRRAAEAIHKAMRALLSVAPKAGSYVSESSFFERDWQQSYWGTNYSRLLAVKTMYDPDGLFFVHHGVGSEQWSADGFTRHD
jgi:FAD/FMN-containing dehydrogenase